MSPELRRVLRGQLVEALLDQLSGDLASAARTLAFLSRSGGSEPTRLAAARALIELHSRLRSDVELEGRIQALEDDKAADQGDRP